MDSLVHSRATPVVRASRTTSSEGCFPCTRHTAPMSEISAVRTVCVVASPVRRSCAPRPKQSRIEDVWPVRGRHQDYAFVGLEAVHLYQ